MRLSALLLVFTLAGTSWAQGVLPQAPGIPSGAPPAAPATGAAVPCPPECLTPPPVDPGHRFWGGAEYLMWWVQGQQVPALVTSSPVGTPIPQIGALGYPGTAILVGDSRMNDAARSGIRLSVGMWFDDCRTCGVGGEFFILSSLTDGFAAQSLGTPILARPIFNELLGGASSGQILAYPGLAAGTVTGSVESQLLGASAFVRRVLGSESTGHGDGFTVEALAGYRYLNLNERVNIDEQFRLAASGLSASFLLNDSFRTENQFHGGDIGLAGRWTRGKLSFHALGKLAIGANVRDVTLAGSTGASLPGLPPVNLNGGLLTAGRTGHLSDCTFALVPEVRLGVGYRIADCASVTAGYNLMWWTNVARAGDQINLSVNPALLAPGIPPASSIAIRDTTLWIQGINLGLAFDY